MAARSLFDNIQKLSNERAKLLSLLIKKIADIQLAEDCLQEAFLKAYELWGTKGVPKNPQSWLLKTAYNQAIDWIRRQSNFLNKQQTLKSLIEISKKYDSIQEDELIPDERLKLIFVCCHPALDQQSQVALTLNTICGLSVEDIAESFIVAKTTMAQRLVRVKRKIKLTQIAYQLPSSHEFKQRLDAVLSVIYLIYNRGYSPSLDETCENEYTNEALYLIKTLNQLIPNQAEILGLHALMCFHQSRAKARNSNNNEIITLENQDRRLWDKNLIEKANSIFKKAVALNCIGPYQIQAAISGVHSQAQQFNEIDWNQIVALYDRLYQYLPSDTVLINQAVALSYNQQNQRALDKILSIDCSKLQDYQPYYLAKAHILKSLKHNQEAINNLSLAMALAKNIKQQRFLQNQIDLINS